LYVGQPKQLFLQKVYDERYNFFNSLKAGNPAPAFTLPDSKGITHALSAFAGKVIYIDFWASWCGPCREETPAMKKLYSKFKEDDRLAIISIAVSDAKENWMQALANDKPEWLQLRDHKGELQKSYNTNSIPRFVLIDKKGKIVSMDAPRPSNTESLMKLIVSEIKK
jgi:thiol-disulfide isomerase/thioredoxin